VEEYRALRTPALRAIVRRSLLHGERMVFQMSERQPAAGSRAGHLKLKVFVSYSRADAAFAHRLAEALESPRITATFDIRDLPSLEDWRRELLGFIREADAVVFIVSPSSIQSPVCAWEVAQAAKLNKRIAPVVLERVSDDRIPPEAAKINYVFFDPPNDFSAQVDRLGRALLTDISWVKEHTRLAELGRRWKERSEAASLLLRGDELDQAERWLLSQPRESPHPTSLQQEFLAASRQAARSRQRRWLAGSFAATVIAAGLAAAAMWQRQIAVINEQTAILARQDEAKQRAIAVKNEEAAIEARTLAERKRDEALLAQSNSLAALAFASLKEHDSTKAALIAMEALPDPAAPDARPLSHRAERALYESVVAVAEKDVVAGHNHRLSPAALHPTERKVAYALGEDGYVVDYNDRKLAPLVLKGHYAGVISAVFSPDGGRVATISEDRAARIWDYPNGHPLKTLYSAANENILHAGFIGQSLIYVMYQPPPVKTLPHDA
jgi:hypothetical protein